MRFHYGSVPETPNFHPIEEGWHAILEPGPVLIQILAIPVAAACVVGLSAALIFGRPGLVFSLTPDWTILLVLILILPVHELLHALGFPGFGFTPETQIGFWPSKLLLYACHTGKLSKSRYLLVYTIPFLMLSALPIAFLALVRPLPFGLGVVSSLAFMGIVNAAAASGDVIGFFLVLFQIPWSAKVRNQGWKTYWKDERKVIADRL